MPRWSGTDDSRLQALVRSHGTRWQKFFSEGLFPGRSIVSIRLRWSTHVSHMESIPEQSDSDESTSDSVASCIVLEAQAALTQVPPTTMVMVPSSPRMSADNSFAITESDGSTAMSHKWPPLDVSWVRDVYNCASSRKGWTYGLKGAHVPSKKLTKSEQEKVKNWKLTDGAGSPVIACRLENARKLLMRHRSKARWRGPLSLTHREEFGMVIHPRECLPTFVGAHRLFLGGPQMGPGRLMLPSEAAMIMGIPRRTGLFIAAQRAMGEEDLWKVVCDSIDIRFALTLAWNGADMAGWLAQGWSTTRPIRFGVLYAGAVDPVMSALRQVTGAKVEMVVAMEKEETRLQIVQKVHSVPYIFKDVHRAATFLKVPLDFLHASPSCKKLSTAPHWTKAQIPVKAAEAKEELLADVRAICTVVVQCGVSVVTIEETDALVLRSMHAEAYEEMWRLLHELPFEWRHSVIDVADLHASHRRSRAGWAGRRRAADAQVAGAHGDATRSGDTC